MQDTQDEIFNKHEADDWYERNLSEDVKPVSDDNNIIKAIKLGNLPEEGNFIDLGGGAGSIAAGIINILPKWKGTVLELSNKAVNKGAKLFPKLSFINGSLTKYDAIKDKIFDLAVISMVLHLIDRKFLSIALANIDQVVKPGGFIIIQDFYSPFPKANKSSHRKGIFIFKQDYVASFLALNTYTEIYRMQGPTQHSVFDKNDPYDVWVSTTILKKELLNRYRISE